MHLDIGNSQAHDFCNAIKNLTLIFILRVEESVLRALSSGVPGSIIGDFRPHSPPLGHALEGVLNGSALPNRFVMVGDGNPGPFGFYGPEIPPYAILQIRPKPYFCMSREDHRVRLTFVRFGRPNYMDIVQRR